VSRDVVAIAVAEADLARLPRLEAIFRDVDGLDLGVMRERAIAERRPHRFGDAAAGTAPRTNIRVQQKALDGLRREGGIVMAGWRRRLSANDRRGENEKNGNVGEDPERGNPGQAAHRTSFSAGIPARSASR